VGFNFQLELKRLWEAYGKNILELGRRAIIILLIIAGGKIVISFSGRLTHKAVTGKLKLDENLSSVMRMAFRYGVVIVCLIMILDVLGINTNGLIALLGAAGVAVGFSLRDTLGNIAAGIIILFLRPFRKGDFIECGSISGSVREMGLFAATLETPDGIFISAPNSSLWGLPLKNYSRNPNRRMDISVSISYSDSIDEAFKVLDEIVREESRFLKEPPGKVMVQSLGDSGIGITLRAWVRGADYWSVYWDLMKKVKEKIEEAGLSIPFPQRDVRLVKAAGKT
jgi:small conductance mechanosensitive channel